MATRTYTLAEMNTALGVNVVTAATAAAVSLDTYVKGRVVAIFDIADPHNQGLLFWVADVIVNFDDNNLFQVRSNSLTTAEIGAAI